MSVPPHAEACVRSPELARVVGEVLGRVPHSADSNDPLHLVIPVVTVATLPRPAVDILGQWSAPLEVTTDQLAPRVLVAAVRASKARDFAASLNRHAAVKLSREPPKGCVWALYLGEKTMAVLCLRPAVTRSGMAGAA